MRGRRLASSTQHYQRNGPNSLLGPMSHGQRAESSVQRGQGLGKGGEAAAVGCSTNDGLGLGFVGWTLLCSAPWS